MGKRMTRAILILMRHGQSTWNRKNLFTGWVDVPLSPEGIKEAEAAGKLIAPIPIDVAFTSALIRSIMTALLVLNYHSSGKTAVLLHPNQGHMNSWATIHSDAVRDSIIPIYCSQELNERMYGELQGFDKQEMVEKFGKEQMQLWRRSYDVAPPGGESLQMTAERSIPYFQNHIFPYLTRGNNVFIAAHGNSLRAIVMQLDKLNKEQVVQLEIPTGLPLIYEYLDGAFFKRSLEEVRGDRER